MNEKYIVAGLMIWAALGLLLCFLPDPATFITVWALNVIVIILRLAVLALLE